MTSLSTPLEQATDRQAGTNLLARLQTFAWGLGLAGILLALLAQSVFDQRQLQQPLADPTPIGLALLAMGLFALASRQVALEADSETVPFRLPPRPRLAVLGFGVALCLLAAVSFRDNDIGAAELVIWLVGLGVCLLAAWRPERDGGRQTADGGWLSAARRLPSAVTLSWPLAALLAILAVGAFYRLHDLHNLPAEMGADLFENYEDMRYMLERGVHPIFFSRNQGREPMLYYLTAIVARFFGLSHYTLKLTTVLIGLATIPLFYLLGRELFNREVGLYAALWLAVSKWHVSLSRSGISFVLLLLLAAITMLALIRALRRGRPLDYALLGISLGAGLYTYKPSPFIIPATILAALLVALPRRQVRVTLAGLALALALAVAVYAPLGAYALTNREEYARRIEVQTRIVGEAYARQPSPLQAFIQVVGHSLAMYNLIGDGNGWFNPPYQRQLGFATGALLLAGAGALLARLRHGFNAILLAFFAVMLLPLIIAIPPPEWGNVSYGLGTLAPVLIIAALPAVAIRRMALAPGPDWRLEFTLESGQRAVWSLQSNLQASRRILTALLLVALIVVEARDNWMKFFYDYRDGLPGHNFPLERTMAQDIAAFSDSGPAYIRAAPYWYNGTVVQARLESEHHLKLNMDVLDLETQIPAGQIPAQLPAGRVLVILHPDDKESLDALKAAIPRHLVLERRDYEGKIAYLMFAGER